MGIELGLNGCCLFGFGVLSWKSLGFPQIVNASLYLYFEFIHACLNEEYGFLTPI